MSETRRIIEPTRGWRFLDLRELAHYRELLFFLTWRDIKVRYKQTVIGIAWAVLQPLALMLVFTLFFGRLARMDQQMDIPYPLFAYAGLLPWQLFARTLSESTSSLVTDQRLITKVYFPRILVPTSYCLAAVLDFLIGTVLLLGLMAWYGVAPGMAVLWLPLFILLMFISILGIGYWLSALNTEYRDVMYIVPFLVQFWMFVTPVVYPSTLVPERFRWLLGLNPMSGVVEGLRWCMLGYGPRPGPMLLVSVLVAVVVFISGIAWFRYRERTFVDTLGGQ
jgi:lipopolysaccharide transport system permease protein